MKKIFISSFLFITSLSLLCSQKNKKWENENSFQATLEKLMKRCFYHQNRLLDQGVLYLDEEIILKTHDALKVEDLRKKNPHLEHRYQAALKKARE